MTLRSFHQNPDYAQKIDSEKTEESNTSTSIEMIQHLFYDTPGQEVIRMMFAKSYRFPSQRSSLSQPEPVSGPDSKERHG
ncbi:MAG: hypothetical protein HOP08_18300 [Cyclobacteriaceae bacterium]|nr:hypothetical protein [Cyclobacteriaceae bacterium]